MLGGSSAINGLVYIRGNPLDFDRWEEEGARGWAYRDVLPYFRRAETRAEGGDEYRGSSGPLHTRYGQLRNPLYRAFIDAAREAGYPETDDVNGYQQEGFGRFDMTVHHGRRWSAASPISARRCAAERRGAHPCAGDTDHLRRAAGDRRRLRRDGVEHIGAGDPRGDRLGRRRSTRRSS